MLAGSEGSNDYSSDESSTTQSDTLVHVEILFFTCCDVVGIIYKCCQGSAQKSHLFFAFELPAFLIILCLFFSSSFFWFFWEGGGVEGGGSFCLCVCVCVCVHA